MAPKVLSTAFLDLLALVSFPLGQEHLSAVEPTTVYSGAEPTRDIDI